MSGEPGSRIAHFKERVFELLEGTNSTDRGARVVGGVIIGVIMINVAAVIFETVASIDGRFHEVFHLIESVSVAVFTLEYVLRLWSCTSQPRYRRSVLGRVRFMFTPLAIIDLMVILPNYLALVHGLDLRSVRAFRLIRLTRLLKVGRYSRSLKTLGAVLEAKREDLTVTAVCIGFLLVVMSSVIYFVEREAQPEVFSSIPETMWWAVITLTTVGYGDVTPVTPLGRALGGLVALTGIGIFALPAGILASGFTTVRREKDNSSVPQTCPHCGAGLGTPSSTESLAPASTPTPTPTPASTPDDENLPRAA